MGRAAAARKLASAAVYGGGGLTALGAGLYAVLTAEALIAKKVIGAAQEHTINASGLYGAHRPGNTITVALLGDSVACGYGVEIVEDTPGAALASGLSEYANAPVHLGEYAVIGAKSTDIAAQIRHAMEINPDIVVILVGANDVTHLVRPSAAIQALAESVRRLRDAGIQVVVGTCPDLGTIKPIAPPLKQIAREWSHRLAAAQTIAVVEAGGRTVSLGSLLGPEFEAAPAILFGPDRFHPSVEGYRTVAGVLLPTVLALLGLIEDHEVDRLTTQGARVWNLTAAAVEASTHPGTEVGGALVGGTTRGERGRWAELQQRPGRPQGTTEAPLLEPESSSALN